MYEGDFIPAADAKAKRHEAAVAAINASLSSGALASPAARRDPKIVRDELNKAWQIGASVVEDLERQFPIVSPPKTATATAGTTDAGAEAGSDGGAPAAPLPEKPARLVSITDRAASGDLGLTRIHASRELTVLGADGTSSITLEDVIGRKAEGTKAGDGVRIGDEAWSEIRYTWATTGDEARRRAFLKNVQNALNHRLAVPVAWAVTRGAKEGVYRGEGTTEANVTGLHESILVDYQVDDVPGFGTLTVDVRETRPEALEAALDDAANVKFFRIKNSWGVDPVWTEEEMRQYGIRADDGQNTAAKPNYLPSKPGYNDLLSDYLDLTRTKEKDSHFMLRLALPLKLRFAVPASVAPPDADGGVEGGASDGGSREGGTTDGGAGKK